MKNFVYFNCNFWINYDNVELMHLDVDAKLLAVYLISNTHQNMFGIYYLPITSIASEIKLSVEKVKRVLQELCGVNYCSYDEKTQYIWVRNMALEPFGENLEANNNRIKSLQVQWLKLPSNMPFLKEFYQKYRSIFALEKRLFVNSVKISKM